MLEDNNSIEKLVIGDNNVSDITCLNEMLVKNKTLKILDLSHNNIKNINNAEL